MVEAFDKWIEADGWDNPEWDAVSDTFGRIREFLGLGSKPT
jgi:hypothetical protein